MQLLRKIITALLLLGAAILALGMLVIGFNNKGLWTLFYLVEAGLLLMYAYVYLPVVVTLVAFPWLKRMARPVVSPEAGATYFAILVPAHNEARLLPQLLTSLRAQRYPRERFQIFVVADNCTDNTAELARSGGAICFERHTSKPSNKGQALTYAWDALQVRSEIPADAVIVLVDGDCQLEPNFLAEMDRMMSKPGSAPVVQSFRYVSNSRSSNVSTLDAAAEALRQWVQLGSRKVLGLESQICGSGVAFRRAVFSKLMAGQQHGLVEDKAWRAGLFEDGLKVDWCPSARLGYEAVEDNAAFQKQRKRWVGGQIALIKAFAAKLVWHGLTRLNLSELDCAMTIIQLPRSFMLMLAGMFGMLAFVLPEASLLPWWGWFVLAALFMVYAAFGLFLIQAETRHYLRLLLAPLLVVGVARTTLSSLFGKGVRRWDPTRGGLQTQPQLQATEQLEASTKNL
jgi:cellulose synthase/poly-beta-1,6-N-acetylglucosamine synthase-like glycosyltransferase